MDFYQSTPTPQPDQTQVYDNGALDFAARAKAAALRAYQDSALRDFGSRGELSRDLEGIGYGDFDYSPGALKYLQDTQNYLTNYAGPYNLSSMDMTSGKLPYTSAQLEQFAARGDPSGRMYANFNLSSPDSAWDVGNLQFAPGRQYRLIDRSTGNVLYTGTGYEAGAKISDLAKGLFDQSGQKADWAIEAMGGDGNWVQRYQHVPTTNAFGKFLLAAAPFAALSALPYLGVMGATSAPVAGSAHAGIGATIGAGGLANAAPGIGALSALGAGTAAGALAPAITVFGPAAGGGLSAGALAGVGSGLAAGTSAVSGLGGASNAAATQPAPAAPGGEIVVNAPVGTGAGLPPIDITSGALAGIGASVGAIPGGAVQPTPAGSNPSTLSQISKYLEMAGYGTSILGALLGGGKGGAGGSGTIPGGFGGIAPVFNAQLPSANLPGVGDMSPRVMPAQDWATYGMRPEQSFFRNVPQNAQGFADGGDVRGPGTGRSDSIPAALSDGEYVIDAETVALLGDGSTDAGADMLDQFRINIRKHKGKHLSRGEISPDAKRPEHYLSGGLA